MQTADGNDEFDLSRFTSAQDPLYSAILAEIKNGHKRIHWMWFIFPQIAGLGFSAMSQRYAIGSLAEARQYLAHPVLGIRLRECAETTLAVENKSASAIFGFPDDQKLQSSMTLFSQAAGPDSVFSRVLEKYFSGDPDGETLRRLS